jgi:hypothetical protein
VELGTAASIDDEHSGIYIAHHQMTVPGAGFSACRAAERVIGALPRPVALDALARSKGGTAENGE